MKSRTLQLQKNARANQLFSSLLDFLVINQYVILSKNHFLVICTFLNVFFVRHICSLIVNGFQWFHWPSWNALLFIDFHRFPVDVHCFSSVFFDFEGLIIHPMEVPKLIFIKAYGVFYDFHSHTSWRCESVM